MAHGILSLLMNQVAHSAFRDFRVALPPHSPPTQKQLQVERVTMSTTMQKWRNLSTLVRRGGNDAVCVYRFLHNNGPDTVEELLDRHLVKREKKRPPDDDGEALLARQRLTSTRREALSLYRDVIRATRFFTWTDGRGVVWRDILRDNVRKEFEESRFQDDPEVVTRLLIRGRDAVQKALENLAEKQRQQVEKEQRGRDDD